MAIYMNSFTVKTRGETDIIDITHQVEEAVKKSGLMKGIVAVWIAGSTAGISTIEYESGLIGDLQEAYERLAPRHAEYEHNLRWGDGNGYAHIRASLVGQDLTIPLDDGKLIRGTWQQIILIDFDNRPRTRGVTVQIVGE